ncbi:uncharacterized protein BDV14DRAFT_184233 [Aspergillus stella-maris]|uniref:uncharacterized protein n=1 Tax=Aspergillus stella-maris TaxID=1810926 RepID=UPI003CCE533E
MVFNSILGWVRFLVGHGLQIFFFFRCFALFVLLFLLSSSGPSIPLFIYSHFFRSSWYVAVWWRGYRYGRRCVSVSLSSMVFFASI